MRKMLNFIRTSPRLILLVTVVILMSAGAGCKSKKKAMEVTDSAAEKAKWNRKQH